MNVHARLADPRLYVEQINRLHRKHLNTSRLYELRQDDVSLASLILKRGVVARLIANTVAAGAYRLEPARVRTITAGSKRRIVFSYGLTDMIVHGAVAKLIEEAATPLLSPSVYSYRTGVSWVQPISKFARYLRVHRKERPDVRQRGIYAIGRDIDSYTDSIPVGSTSRVWSLLSQTIGPAKKISAADWRLIESVVRPEATTGDGPRFTTYRGVPTGQPISCVLFNLYLADFDREFDRIPGSFYARYCDDILFAHPDAEIVKAVDARMRACLSTLQLAFKEQKSRTLYLTAAGRQSTAWPEARGTTTVPFLGCLVSAQGTVALGRDECRRVLSELRRRAWRARRALQSSDEHRIGRTVCAAINRALQARPDFSQQRSASLLRRAVTNREHLKHLDYCIARIVARVVTGNTRPHAFRTVPYRKMRTEWKLLSLYHSRNTWSRKRNG